MLASPPHRKLFRYAAIIGLSGLLALSAGVSAAKSVVTFAHPYADIPGLVSAYEAAVSEFNQSHPDIEVKIVDFPAGQGNQVEKLTVATIAGVAPDVAHVWGVGTAVDMYNAGLTLDLTPMLPKIAEWRPQEYIPAFVDMFRWQGGLVGLPSSAGAAILVRNRTMFEEAGFDGARPPTGLKDAMQYARKLTVISPDGRVGRAGFKPWETWHRQFALPAWFGQDVYDGVHDRVSLNTQAMRDMLDWLKDLYDLQGGFAPVNAMEGDEAAEMATGRLAMIQTSRGVINRITRGNPELVPGKSLAVSPALAAEGYPGAGSLAAADSNVVLRTARDPVAAARFLVEMSVGRSFEAWARRWPLFSASTAVNRRLLLSVANDAQRRIVDEAEAQSLQRTRPYPAFPETGLIENQLHRMSEVLARTVAPDAFLQEVERTIQAAISVRKQKRH